MGQLRYNQNMNLNLPFTPVLSINLTCVPVQVLGGEDLYFIDYHLDTKGRYDMVDNTHPWRSGVHYGGLSVCRAAW